MRNPMTKAFSARFLRRAGSSSAATLEAREAHRVGDNGGASCLPPSAAESTLGAASRVQDRGDSLELLYDELEQGRELVEELDRRERERRRRDAMLSRRRHVERRQTDRLGRIARGWAVVGALVVAGSIASSATAHDPAPPKMPKTREGRDALFLKLHGKVSAAGLKAGRNVVEHGRERDGRYTHNRVKRGIRTLYAKLHPHEHAPPIPADPIPWYVVQCESGGSWTALNASSLAGGRYQIIPSTWRAYAPPEWRHVLAHQAPPHAQAAAAAAILAGQGPGAWECW